MVTNGWTELAERHRALLKAAKQAHQDLVSTDGGDWQIAQLTLAEAIAAESNIQGKSDRMRGAMNPGEQAKPSPGGGK